MVVHKTVKCWGCGSNPASISFFSRFLCALFSKYLQYEMFVKCFYMHPQLISAGGSTKEMK